ncbi:peptidase domain-containing ABC transporter [Apibacter muscae]|uniref:peptidase domain-containing ABC transporter n=1 Tax=Apibacter muscae TaxID=2509004 RepID=UPI0011ABFEDF|nr:peptidase domain-containing ABC transporter [Apibacter muscae]TWP24791.1 peptidase domain-containing ABC transporter [Apibacter muscae]
MRKLKVKQHDLRDCGAACLASIGAYYNINLPIARIRQYASTDKKGTNVLGLIQAAEKMGLTAKGVKGNLDAISQIPLPAIAHVILGEKQLLHYVVIYKVAKNFIEVMDPLDGEMTRYSYSDFEKIWSGVIVLFSPNENFKESNEKISNFKRFWNLVQPHRSILIQCLFGAIIYTVLGLSTSIFIEKITDYVLVDHNKNLLHLLGICMLVILVVQVYIGTQKNFFVLKTGQLIDAQLILNYYKHLLRLPQRFFDTMRIGEIISRVNDALKIRVFINDVAIDFIVNIFIVVFSFILMFAYYWKLALIVTLVIPLYVTIYIIINKLNKKIERRVMEDGADLETQLVESVNNVRTIKEFGIEDYSNKKIEYSFIKLLFSNYKSGINTIFSGTSSQFIASLFTVILLWIGSLFVIENKITPGELFSFYALIGYFTSPIASLVSMNKTIQNALIASDRLFEIMDLEREKTDNRFEIKSEDLGDIRFEDVYFSYGTRTDVFKGFNAVFKKNKTTAVVGESGSGKTTLISLLQNIYPIQKGKIYIGSYDLNYISYQSLRNIMGVIPQQLSLFSGDIIENIALGCDEPDMHRIIDLSQKLGISDFVEKLPQGFQSPVGENGTMLSGGQKQRIAIARALYKEPQILLLDEATSALDTHSERIVQNVINDFKTQNKTVIVIAHRLSTISNADEIFVMDNGLIVEQGDHHSLLSLKGKYFKLWKDQIS